MSRAGLSSVAEVAPWVEVAPLERGQAASADRGAIGDAAAEPARSLPLRLPARGLRHGEVPGAVAAEVTHGVEEGAPTDKLLRAGYHALVESLPEGVILFGPDAEVQFANRAGRHLLAEGSAQHPGGTTAPRLLAAVAAAAEEGAQAEHRCRVGLPGLASVRVTALRTRRGSQALIVRPDAVGDVDVLRVVMDRLSLTSAAARVAVRIYRGQSDKEIAAAFGLRVGAVRMRISRLCRKLGISGRAALLPLVDNAIAASTIAAADPFGAKPALATTATRPFPLAFNELHLLLDHTDIGFAVANDNGDLLCANQAARSCLRSANGGTWSGALPPSLRQAVRRIAGRKAPAGAGTRLWLTDGDTRLQLLLWLADSSGLVGLQIRSEGACRARLEESLQARFKVSPRQARLAVELAGPSPSAALGRALHLTPGGFRAACARLYRRVGVRRRLALTALVREIGTMGPVVGSGR